MEPHRFPSRFLASCWPFLVLATGCGSSASNTTALQSLSARRLAAVNALYLTCFWPLGGTWQANTPGVLKTYDECEALDSKQFFTLRAEWAVPANQQALCRTFDSAPMSDTFDGAIHQWCSEYNGYYIGNPDKNPLYVRSRTFPGEPISYDSCSQEGAGWSALAAMPLSDCIYRNAHHKNKHLIAVQKSGTLHDGVKCAVLSDKAGLNLLAQSSCQENQIGDYFVGGPSGWALYSVRKPTFFYVGCASSGTMSSQRINAYLEECWDWYSGGAAYMWAAAPNYHTGERGLMTRCWFTEAVPSTSAFVDDASCTWTVDTSTQFLECGANCGPWHRLGGGSHFAVYAREPSLPLSYVSCAQDGGLMSGRAAQSVASCVEESFLSGKAYVAMMPSSSGFNGDVTCAGLDGTSSLTAAADGECDGEVYGSYRMGAEGSHVAVYGPSGPEIVYMGCFDLQGHHATAVGSRLLMSMVGCRDAGTGPSFSLDRIGAPAKPYCGSVPQWPPSSNTGRAADSLCEDAGDRAFRTGGASHVALYARAETLNLSVAFSFCAVDPGLTAGLAAKPLEACVKGRSLATSHIAVQESPGGFLGDVLCVELEGTAGLAAAAAGDCEEKSYGGHRLGKAGHLAVYEVTTGPVWYWGCYDRQGAAPDSAWFVTSLAECRDLAAFSFFGGEDAGNAPGNATWCASAEDISSWARKEDSECELKVHGGYRLGAAGRMAVYAAFSTTSTTTTTASTSSSTSTSASTSSVSSSTSGSSTSSSTTDTLTSSSTSSVTSSVTSTSSVTATSSLTSTSSVTSVTTTSSTSASATGSSTSSSASTSATSSTSASTSTATVSTEMTSSSTSSGTSLTSSASAASSSTALATSAPVDASSSTALAASAPPAATTSTNAQGLAATSASTSSAEVASMASSQAPSRTTSALWLPSTNRPWSLPGTSPTPETPPTSEIASTSEILPTSESSETSSGTPSTSAADGRPSSSGTVPGFLSEVEEAKAAVLQALRSTGGSNFTLPLRGSSDDGRSRGLVHGQKMSAVAPLGAAPLRHVEVPLPEDMGSLRVLVPSNVFAERFASVGEEVVLLVSPFTPPEGVLEGAGFRGGVSLDFHALSGPYVSVEGLEPPVVMRLDTNYTDPALQCAYFDEASQRWSTRGVLIHGEKAVLGQAMWCETTHLSFFAAVLQGILSTLQCANFNLMNSEALRQLFVGDWVWSPAAVLCWLVLGALAGFFAVAAVQDHKRSCWEDEHFLIPAEQAPESGAVAAAATAYSCSGTCSAILSSGELREALDDVVSGWWNHFAEFRALLEGLCSCPDIPSGTEHCGNLGPWLHGHSHNLVVHLLTITSRRLTAASLGLSSDVVDFVLDEKELSIILVRARMEQLRPLAPGAQGMPPGHVQAWDDLRSQIADRMLVEVNKHRDLGPRAGLRMAARLLCSQNPLTLLFIRDIFQSRKHRALSLAVDVLGTFAFSCAFFEASGYVRGKPKAGEVTCGGVDGGMGAKLGRFLVIATGSLLLAGLPASFLASLQTRGFKTVSQGQDSPEWKRHLRAWKLQDRIFWGVGLAYVLACTLFILTFVANIGAEDSNDWSLAGVLGLLQDLLLLPLMLALLLPLMSMALLHTHVRANRLEVDLMIRRVSESFHSRSNVMLPLEAI